MAGTWMAIVQGFGGMRIADDSVVFNPFLPKEWDSYRFHIVFREARILVEVKKGEVKISHLSGPEIKLRLFQKEHLLSPNSSIHENSSQ
jgi:maltose phosphorylase